nr:DnaD domain protein [Limosilactobacillus kribbianus]
MVTGALDFVNFNEQTFVDFYQPILGPVAFSLFYALRSQMMTHPTLADRRLQSELLVQTNAGQTTVGEGLQRLESSGMVVTYHRHDAQGDVYVYELQATLTPAQFVADNLLSVLLLEEIGEKRFDQLMKQAQAYQLADTDPQLKNVSHHFLDTYRVDQREVVHLPQVIQNAQKRSRPVSIKRVNTLATDFDWPTLLQLLEGQPLVRTDLTAQRQLIEVEHQLYGIDEPTMARLIRLATDLSSNHFDAQKFKRVVASYYQKAPAEQVMQAQVPAQSMKNSKDLTDKDRLLLKSADNYAPIEFLQALKEQTGGYVTAGERNVLTRLVQDGQLPSSVINVLVWYVIADLGNATLKGNFVDAIANDWLRAGVKDGADALMQLKKFNQAKQENTPRNRGARRNYRQLQVREKIPEWSKQDQKQKTKKASPEAIARARALQRKNSGNR